MQDFLLNEDGDLAIQNGDFVLGLSDEQHQELLLILGKGSLKPTPLCGVGAVKYLESEDDAAFLREVRTQFAADGMQVNAISFEDNKLNVDANY